MTLCESDPTSGRGRPSQAAGPGGPRAGGAGTEAGASGERRHGERRASTPGAKHQGTVWRYEAGPASASGKERRSFQFGLIRNLERCQQSGEIKEQGHEARAVTSPSNCTQARGREAHFCPSRAARDHPAQELAITPPLCFCPSISLFGVFGPPSPVGPAQPPIRSHL